MELWRQRAGNQRELNRELASTLRLRVAELDGVRSELAAAHQERALLERLTARLAEQNTAMMERVDGIVRQMVEIAHRPVPQPEIAATVREIGAALSSVLNGHPQQVQVNGNGQANPPQIVDLYGDSSPGPSFVPLHEIDPLMSHEEPIVGEWNAHTATPSHMILSPQSEITHQVNPVTGRVERTDGTPMFQAGSTGPPPVGGLE